MAGARRACRGRMMQQRRVVVVVVEEMMGVPSVGGGGPIVDIEVLIATSAVCALSKNPDPASPSSAHSFTRTPYIQYPWCFLIQLRGIIKSKLRTMQSTLCRPTKRRNKGN